MAKTKTDEDVTTTEETPGGGEALTVEQVQELIAKETKDLKADLAGMHRVKDRLEKDNKTKDLRIEDLEKEHLDETERHKLELEERERRLAARERDLLLKDNREKATRFLDENKLPLKYADVVPLDSWDEASTRLEEIKSVVDADRASVLEDFKKTGGDTPPAGGPVPTGKKRSEMTVDEATAYAKEHGVEAFQALPN